MPLRCTTNQSLRMAHGRKEQTKPGHVLIAPNAQPLREGEDFRRKPVSAPG